MNIPPVIGMVAALTIGIAIGAGGMYQHFSKEQLKVEAKVKDKDNKAAKVITAETNKAKADKKLKNTVDSYKSTRTCKDLTNEEVDAICINRYVPVTVMQSIQEQISNARERTHCL